MADCFVTPDVRQQRLVNKEIERQLREDKRKARREVKCVLVGTPQSGKSTFIKQMRIEYGEGYSLEEKKAHAEYVFRNTCGSNASVV